MTKRFTLFVLTALMTVASFAQPTKQQQLVPFQAPTSLQQTDLKGTLQQPKQHVLKAKAQGPKKAKSAADLVGTYTATYLQTSNQPTQTYTADDEDLTQRTNRNVKISLSDTGENLVISNFFNFGEFNATVESDEDGDFLVIQTGQIVYTNDTYGECELRGLFYYEGDDTNEAGWYFTNQIYASIGEDGTITFDPTVWVNAYITSGDYANYSYFYDIVAVELAPQEETEVAPPDGAEILPYVMTYGNADGSESSTALSVAFDGTTVYFQGFSSYTPEAWVVGTLDANGGVTIAADQDCGLYIDSYPTTFPYAADLVGTYDASTGVFTFTDEFYGLLNANGSYYYNGHYYGAVLTPVVEKAGTPETPTISGIEATDYGDVLLFDIPLVDTEGNALNAKKLTYQVLAEVNGQVQVVTFTTDDFVKLTEDMDTFPYGFSEDYDFNNGEIYLNMDHSKWSKVGIQTTYTGGGETHQSEIGWLELEADGAKLQWVAAEQGYENQEKVNDIDFGNGFTATMADGGNSSTPTYYNNQSALRLYKGNTLTFNSVLYNIVQIKFQTAGETYTNLQTEDGTTVVSGSNVIWTADEGAKSVTFTVASDDETARSVQARIVSLTIIYDTALEFPENAEEYKFVATADYGEDELEEVERSVFVAAVEGSDYVLFKGLSEAVPEAIFVTKKNDAGNYVIAADQYIGDYAYYWYTYPLYTRETTLAYDAEKDEYTTNSFVLYTIDESEDEETGETVSEEVDFEIYADVVITKIIEVAGTPANPSVANVKLADVNYPYIQLNIPTVDTNGNDMLTSKLFYEIYIENDEGDVFKYVASTADYTNLTENLDVFPYTFSDDWDIYVGGNPFYVYDEDGVNTWAKIGVKSIYTGGGETNETEIQWLDLSEYWESVGILDINAAVATGNVRFYDLQGRETTSAATGVVIAVSKMSDGTTKAVKMLRK